MKGLTAMHQQDIIEAALEKCATEPVRIPGSVQPHGAIVVVDNESLKVTHASENLSSLTGIDVQAALGRDLYDVFPKGTRHDLVNNLLPAFLNQKTRMIEKLTFGDQVLFAGAAAAGPATVFEFEPLSVQRNMSNSAISQLAFLTAQLQGLQTQEQLFDKTVRLLQVLTGYKRVMVYAFDEEGNGQIKAEATSGELEPFLGLHFPSWDIPAQAREIMMQIPFRYIANIDATPCPVIAADGYDTALDLTNAHLRGVSPVHMRYLKNMGTQSSFTLNVVVGGRLWGMIALHHTKANVPDQSAREVCRNFVRLFELSLDSIIQRERIERLHEAGRVTSELKSQASADTKASFFNQTILDRLRETMQADGAVLAKDGVTMCSGTTPAQDDLPGLITFGLGLKDPFYSHKLATDHPEAAESVGPNFAGLHITPMGERCFIAFLRRDREQVTEWAGAPEKTIVGSGADARLNPRGSFATYKQKVKGSCAPWSPEEHQIASDVWAILVASERQALIQQTTRQQKLIIDELNHRVRNILTLIRSLSRQSRSSTDSIDEYVETLEARIEAVANAHSLAVQKPDAFVSLRAIFDIESAPFNMDEQRISLIGSDFGIRPDVAPVFALVVHELMTNAAKYGALSQPGGTLVVDFVETDGGLTLNWRERDGPPVAQPTKEGFGSTLLAKAVPNEIGGKIAIDFEPTGVEASIFLPQAVFTGARFISVAAPRPPAATTARAPSQAYGSRSALRSLLLEDSFVVSMDTLRVMNEVGIEQIQTAMTVDEALSSIDARTPDFAVLDVNLSAGQTSLPVARYLMERGVKFVFVTGYGSDAVPNDLFADVPILQKPLQRAVLEATLKEMNL
ncbi:MAG: HWE histidine kinase domain-containing protein [Pseudomonadota bacterium]